jgi:hypothetical protein
LCVVSPAASPLAWRRGRRHGASFLASRRGISGGRSRHRLASECGDFAHRSGVATDSYAEAAAEERGWADVSAGRAMRG